MCLVVSWTALWRMIKFIHLTWKMFLRRETKADDPMYPRWEDRDGLPRDRRWRLMSRDWWLRRVSPRRKTDVAEAERRDVFPWDGGQRQTSSRPKTKMDGPYVCPWVGRPERMAETDISDTEVQDGEYKSMCFYYKLVCTSVTEECRRETDLEQWLLPNNLTPCLRWQ